MKTYHHKIIVSATIMCAVVLGSLGCLTNEDGSPWKMTYKATERDLLKLEEKFAAEILEIKLRLKKLEADKNSTEEKDK